MSDDERWTYESPGTLLGQLQRGLGRGAVAAGTAPDAPRLVMDCLRTDRRWDAVDERDVYLARLVRDLGMPVEPVVELLFTAPPEEDDHLGTFGSALGVVERLGVCGNTAAIEGAGRYVREGTRWLDALERIARIWPVEAWDDLLQASLTRLAGEDPFWRGLPWTHWADRSRRVRDEIETADRRRPAPRPERTPLPPDLRLLELLGERGGNAEHRAARSIIKEMGAAALPVARRWAAEPEHAFRWLGYTTVAAHGGEQDVPLIISGMDFVPDKTWNRCGYDVLVTGLARIGGDAAREAVPRIKRLWFSPHSYERAAYLKALVALVPEPGAWLAEGLWDCEADVRAVAVERVPLEPWSEDRLRYLRDDPMEAGAVRAAASRRLDQSL